MQEENKEEDAKVPQQFDEASSDGNLSLCSEESNGEEEAGKGLKKKYKEEDS